MEVEYQVTWDTTMGTTTSAGSEAKRLMAKAFYMTLTVPQQQQLLAEIARDPRLVYHIGLTPNKVLYVLHSQILSKVILGQSLVQHYTLT